MMKNATRLENAMPITVSVRMREKLRGAWLGARLSGRSPVVARCSSTSCDACQKKS